MAKTELMWLTKDSKWGCNIELWKDKPYKNNGIWYPEISESLYCFCSKLWPKFAPALKLRKGQIIRVKKTLLKNGFKLEMV